MFIELVALAVFVAIVLIVVVLFEATQRRVEDSRPTLTETPLVEGARIEGQRSGFARWLLVAAASAVPQSAKQIESIGRELKRAGHYGRDALIEFLAFRNILAFGLLLLFGVPAVLSDPATPIPGTLMATGLVTAALGYGLPRLILAQQAKRRVRRIENGLPDALDLVSMCLSGGMTLSESMERTGVELVEPRPDIAVEFGIIRRQADADSMGVALRNFSNRIDTPDTRALAALVSQTEQLGTSVSAAISDFSDAVRLTARQRAEERAGRASIALLFPVITCLAPPIFLLLCGPPMLRLADFVRSAHEPGGPLDPGALSRQAPLDFDDPLFGMPKERIGGNNTTAFRAEATPSDRQPNRP